MHQAQLHALHVSLQQKSPRRAGLVARGARGERSCRVRRGPAVSRSGLTGPGSRVTRNRLGRNRVMKAEEGQNLETDQRKC